MSDHTMRRVARVSTLVGAAFLQAAFAIVTGAQPVVVPSQLVRCAPGSELSCIVTTMELSSKEARLAREADSALSRNWTGRLAGLRLIGPAIRPVRTTSTPYKLMVL